MPNLQLTWSQAGVLSVVLLAAGLLLRLRGGGRGRALAPFVHEAGVIGVLYALWQFAGTLAGGNTAGAFSRANWIARAERDWRLPDEADLQGPLLAHPLLGQAANLYYASLHFAMLFAFLFWLFLRHRERYAFVRMTIIVFTAASLLIQLIPVAPPRLLPGRGFTDVAAHYGQSVYAIGALGSDQLSAMPSVHVGWAFIVGAGVVVIGTSPWRWFALGYPVLTTYVVVATGNHWWADGIGAVALLAAVVAIQVGVGRLPHPVSGMRMTRSSAATGSPRPSRLDVVTQSAPSGARATVRRRPNSRVSTEVGEPNRPPESTGIR